MAKLRIKGNASIFDTLELCAFARDGDKKALAELTKRAAESGEVRRLLKSLVVGKAKEGPLSSKKLKAAGPSKPSPWSRMASKGGRGWVSITSGGLPSLGKKR